MPRKFYTNITFPGSLRVVDGCLEFLILVQAHSRIKRCSKKWVKSITSTLILCNRYRFTCFQVNFLYNSYHGLQLNTLQSEIEGIYGKAKFCPEGNSTCLSLEPGMYFIMPYFVLCINMKLEIRVVLCLKNPYTHRRIC